MPLISVPHNLKTEVLSWPFPSRTVVPLEDTKTVVLLSTMHNTEEINADSETAAAIFWVRPIHVHQHRHRRTVTTQENTIMYKTEVVITQKREQMSLRYQRLLQCCRAFQVRLQSNRQRQTSEISVRCKVEVHIDQNRK